MHPHSTLTSLRSLSKTSSLLVAGFVLTVCFFLPPSANAQTEVTGAIEGTVTSSQNPNEPVVGASVQIINLDSQVQTATKTDANGHFVRNQLQPGRYKVVVKAQNFKDYESDKVQRVDITLTNKTFPLPISLEPSTVAAAAPPATPTQPSQPGVTPSPAPGTPPATTGGTAAPSDLAEETDIRNEINTTDGRRGGGYREKEVATLPLGGTTLTRTFDELALLLPGVAPPPQTLGSVAGPGVGAGVGSAGQFSVNGLRSRANNFTVDGSDNNDEDIGVRRQGFFALIPQPIESIQEYRVITLLAPAQYGRNIGAQVNAVSKSGGNQYHGTIYGLFNSSQLNAPNAFDSTSGNTTTPLQGRLLNPDRHTLGAFRNVYLDCPTGNPATCPQSQVFVTNNAGGKDSFTLGQGGFVFGGPLVPSNPANPTAASLFFFVSAEGQVLNATKEENFAVPTVEERGAFKTGATGLFFDPLFLTPDIAFPTTVQGDAIFSLFPFPNNPNGVYGRNTLTQVLPSSAQSKIFSGKINGNFRAFGKPQEFVARYNFTQDWREIPVTGGAIFSTLRPRVRTQNFSTFLNTQLNNTVSNQLRLSYGRTRLVFEEVRDTSHLIPSVFANGLPANQRAFLLNARTILNDTLPGDPVVFYDTASGSVEQNLNQFGSGRLAPIGQVSIAGYSPVGVDVFNFPQRRVNNTYQLADTVTTQSGKHNLVFGADLRRTELSSDLPRNARPLLTFNALPNITGILPERPFFTGADFAAASAPTGIFQSLNRGDDAKINLRYYQLNFFGQDQLRIRRNLSLSFGLRYEYNTVPHSANNKIENTFSSPIPAPISGLSQFISGRTSIYDPDKNNFAPRVGFAYSPEVFKNRTTVFRAGAGIYFDQILGAVVSQSRNVFPNNQNVNFAGFGGGSGAFSIFTPGLAFITCPGLGTVPLIQSGTLNTINPLVPQSCFTTATANAFPAGFPVTLPARKLDTPMAYQYSGGLEQQVGHEMVFSAAYVGTLGRHLLRQTTPNLGTNALAFVTDFFSPSFVPQVFGFFGNPGSRYNPATGGTTGGRPVANIGGVTRFTSDANSRYDALQVQMRGRFTRRMQFQVAYTFSSVKDNASDMFDLAGAPALPQDSLVSSGEYAPSNFDARHRIAYNYLIDFPRFKGGTAQAILGNMQIAGTGQFQTGQPFTVNSIFDVNLDGNLTDRLNSTSGIVVTGDPSQPLRLTVDPLTLLAPLGRDGSVPRNSFRAGNLCLTNLAVIKKIGLSEQVKLAFRTEFFNLLNRKNYGIPVRFLEAPSFGRATDTVTPGRRIQFALKLDF
jgi:hypothetical protein